MPPGGLFRESHSPGGTTTIWALLGLYLFFFFSSAYISEPKWRGSKVCQLKSLYKKVKITIASLSTCFKNILRRSSLIQPRLLENMLPRVRCHW